MMKRFMVSALAMVALSATLWAQVPANNPPAGSPVARHGQLSVQGNKIVNKDGNPVALRGMSLFWDCWSDFYNAGAIQTLASDWKADLVRVAYSATGKEPHSSPGNKTKATTVINEAIRQGIYVIIDWHSHFATQEEAEAKAFFADMANTYKNYPNIIYEIFNEPVEDGKSGAPAARWPQIKSYAEAVIPSIRQHDTRNIIVVGTDDYSKRVDLAAANPPTCNGCNNMAYALHFYASQEGHKNELRGLARTALNRGVPVFVTEFGITEADGGGTIDTNEANTWFRFMDENHISWANWALHNKNESSSAITGGGTSGPWSTSQLSFSGNFIRNKLIMYGTPITVTIAKQGEGTATANPSGQIYPGTTVKFSATAGNGYRFEGWSGGDVNGSAIATTDVFVMSGQNVTAVFFAVNQVTNSTFTAGPSGWSVTTGPGGAGSGAVVNGEYRVTVTTAGPTVTNRNLRLQQTGVTLTQGRRYKLSFKARAASGSRQITPVVANAQGSNFMDTAAVTLTGTMGASEREFNYNAATVTNAVVAFYCGGATGDWFIDDVSLVDMGPSTSAGSHSHIVTGPFRTKFNGKSLTLSGGGRVASVAVYDVSGRVRMSQKVQLSGSGTAVSLDRLPAGVYSVMYKVDGKVAANERIMLSK
ncbi:MAG: cellulase family glycosylhydrolase [Chitinispirillia bacterium]|nr:cellulase family glycosylhydrolase [Chitinispirillia bacterium]